MRETDRIRALCDRLDGKPRKYKELYSDYITVHMTEELKSKVIDLSIKKDLPMATVCRELIQKGLTFYDRKKKNNVAEN